MIRQACNGCGRHVPIAQLTKVPKGWFCVECSLRAVAVAEEMRARKVRRMVRERKAAATHDWWDDE